MTNIQFPSEEEWSSLYESTGFGHMLDEIHDILGQRVTDRGILSALRSIETKEFAYQMQYRLPDVAKSYVFMQYFYQKGIPDDEWYRSPSDSGASIEYFPNSDDNHFLIKDWFDYFAHAFYIQVFSFFDVIGHLLNAAFSLGLERPSYAAAVLALEGRESTIHGPFCNIEESSAFRNAKDIRNNVVHNRVPSSAGLTVTRKGNRTSLGLHHYTTSTEMIDNARECIGLLESAVSIVVHEVVGP